MQNIYIIYVRARKNVLREAFPYTKKGFSTLKEGKLSMPHRTNILLLQYNQAGRKPQANRPQVSNY